METEHFGVPLTATGVKLSPGVYTIKWVISGIMLGTIVQYSILR